MWQQLVGVLLLLPVASYGAEEVELSDDSGSGSWAPSPPPSHKSGKGNMVEIVLIIVGSVVALGGAAFCAWWNCRAKSEDGLDQLLNPGIQKESSNA
jgi:hypothetical protein